MFFQGQLRRGAPRDREGDGAQLGGAVHEGAARGSGVREARGGVDERPAPPQAAAAARGVRTAWGDDPHPRVVSSKPQLGPVHRMRKQLGPVHTGDKSKFARKITCEAFVVARKALCTCQLVTMCSTHCASPCSV